MAPQQTSSFPAASFTPPRPAWGWAAGAACWVLGCAGLLGIEDASCDPTYDPRCATTAAAPLLPAAGSGGAAGSAGAAGGSAGGAGGDAGAAGSVGMEAPEAPLCERYCDAVAAACTGNDEQYASPMACRAACALLPEGEQGDVTGNSVECRLARAELARATGESAVYCPTAGPGGGGVCGTDCEGFCELMTETCPSVMGSYEECLPLCADVPNLSSPPDQIIFDVSIQNGNSVQCRLYHVTAATLDARTHCPHAAGVALCTDD